MDNPESSGSNRTTIPTTSWCHPANRVHRFIALIFMCFLCFGSYFCYDTPGALADNFKDDAHLNTSQFALLYSIYSWPNVVLCFIGGYLIDRYFGVRLGTVIYMTIVFFGAVIFALGAYINAFWLMILGRFVFGIGGESLQVAVNNYVVLWFKGKELNMVFGLQLSFSRFGSTVNFWVMEPIYRWVANYYGGYERLGVTLFIASFTCFLSLVCGLLLGWMDHRAEKILGRQEEHSNDEPFRLKDFLNFKSVFWMVSVICVAYYLAIFPFIALGKLFFERKFDFIPQDANNVNSMVYLLSAALSPFFGILIDKTGRNVMWVIVSIVTTIGAHFILAFTFFNPYIGVIILGISYSLLASGLWPLVALIVPENQLGTAYGICQAVQNMGLATVIILAGFIVDRYGYLMLEMFFLGCLFVSLIAAVLIYIMDSASDGVLNMSPSKREALKDRTNDTDETANLLDNEGGADHEETDSRRPDEPPTPQRDVAQVQSDRIRKMESGDFKDFAKAMTDYIAEYLENIRDRQVVPSVKPGYLRPLVPEQAPEKAEPWTAVMSDIERVIMSGVTHWHSPKFHAYFPTANSYPSIVADMLSGAIGCIGFTWIASPACTELEVVMLDWLGQMLGLPEAFLARSGGEGGGVIQGTASEATLVALLGAKSRAMHRVKEQHPEWTDMEILSKLVGYCNNQAHSSVERAGLLGGVKLRTLKHDSKRRLRGDTLREAIEEDIRNGLIPFYAVATLGTTSSCAFDALDELGDVCNEHNVWLHVDAAYAGSAFICPEYRHLMAGVEKADSFNFNPHKWMLVNFDCSAMWLKQPRWIVDAFNVDPIYLKHDHQGSAPDYRHWQIPLGRRFRSLKLWFVLRLFGVENLQNYIRKHIALAHLFEDLCVADPRFEVVEEVTMGLVCFRLKGTNEINEELLRRINGRGKIHLVPSKIDDVFFLRMAVCSRYSEESDIKFSWEEVKASADEVTKANQ